MAKKRRQPSKAQKPSSEPLAMRVEEPAPAATPSISLAILASGADAGQQRVSRRVWRDAPRRPLRTTVQGADPKVNYAKRMARLEQHRRTKELERRLKDEEREERAAERARLEARREQRKRNEQRNEKVQHISDPEKIKRMSRKQLRQIETR